MKVAEKIDDFREIDCEKLQAVIKLTIASLLSTVVNCVIVVHCRAAALVAARNRRTFLYVKFMLNWAQLQKSVDIFEKK